MDSDRSINNKMLAAVALSNNSPRLGMIIFVSFRIIVLVRVVFGACVFGNENELGENVEFMDLKFKFEILNGTENAKDCNVSPSTPAPTPVAPQSISILVDSRIIFGQQLVSECENDITLCECYEFDAIFVPQVVISIGSFAAMFATLLSNFIVVGMIGHVTFGKAIVEAECDAESRILFCMLCFYSIFCPFCAHGALSLCQLGVGKLSPTRPLTVFVCVKFLTGRLLGTMLLCTQNTISFIGIGFDYNVLSPPPAQPCQTIGDFKDNDNVLPENFCLEYIFGVDNHNNHINNKMIHDMWVCDIFIVILNFFS